MTLAINLVISPLLPRGSFAVIAASGAYLWRQVFASITAMLLVFGIVGLHISRLGRIGVFGTTALAVALGGAVSLFSVEYNWRASIVSGSMRHWRCSTSPV